ncbi:MAG: response regulator transcription factor [Anaerolineales bacterium]|nr:response regulator transcription factor [Anaerolineales bacterium]
MSNKIGHILIIDDEAALRQTLARILQQAGFEVTTAENGEQGLSFIQTTNFDLIFMDLRMPGIAGMDALKLIHASFPSLPVILFTAQPDLNSAVEALRNGATDYLLKPLKPQAVIDRARSVLENQQKENRKREIALQIEALQAELKSLTTGQTGPLQAVSLGKDRFLKRGALVLDLHTRRLTINEQIINVPPTSFDYLLVLARHSPNVVNYQTLVAEAQGYQADAREAQELTKWHIHQLRQAIEQDARNPSYLINMRGTGYRLVAD